VTDDQLRRLESVCEDLEAAYVGPYGTVRPEDALEYLLDTYEPPAENESPATDDADAEVAGDPKPEAEPESEADVGADADAAPEELTAIDGVGEVTAAALATVGFDSVAAVEAADPAALTEADGVGEKQAVDIVAAAAAMDLGDVGGDGDENEGADDAADGEADAPGSGDPAAASPSDTLQQAMSLLEAHDDRWRESSGDEPYEVDLPDGSTEGVRTKDDVKRLLFKHWK